VLFDAFYRNIECFFVTRVLGDADIKELLSVTTLENHHSSMILTYIVKKSTYFETFLDVYNLMVEIRK
jgi:hypothetical protein